MEKLQMSLFSVPSKTKRRYFLLLIDYILAVGVFGFLALNPRLITRVVPYEDFWWISTGVIYILTFLVIGFWFYLITYENLGIFSKFRGFIFNVSVLLIISLPLTTFSFAPWNLTDLSLGIGTLSTLVKLMFAGMEYLSRAFLLFPSIIVLILVCIMFVPYLSVFRPTQKKPAQKKRSHKMEESHV